MPSTDSQILDSAKEIASSASTWADVSNALFDSEDGLITRAYPSRTEREAFLKTKEYKAVRELLTSAMDQSGLTDGAAPDKKSGKFVVRLPKSLHAALEKEASNEGTSLNQLVVAKLAVQLSQLASSTHSEMALIAQAYLETREGYSTDRVVCDPTLNRRYLRRCHELGLEGTDYDLNWRLLNARKNSYLSSTPKAKKYAPSSKDEFEFSSEIAIRYIQEKVLRTEGKRVSLDGIICDPDLAHDFDRIAAQLAPGFAPLDYRWVAMRERKTPGRRSADLKKAKIPEFQSVGVAESVKASNLPPEQGIYLFRSGDDSLFVGGTDNLRARIERHFDVSGHRGLPDWLYDRQSTQISLAVMPMPQMRSTERKVIEVDAVNRLHPFFNYSAATSEAA